MPMFNTLTPNQWDYKEPRKGGNGAWNSYCDTRKGTRQTPRAQLAKCKAKFGVSNAPEQNPNSTRRNLDLSVTDADMIAFFEQVDRANCAAAATHSKSTFNKEYSADMLYETIYLKTLKYDDEKKYDPLIRTKVVVGGDPRQHTKIYVVTGTDPETGDDVYEEGTIDDITKNSLVVPIVDFRGLWFASRQFGMSVVCKTIMVWPEAGDEEPQFEGLNLKKRAATDIGSSASKRPRVEVTSADAPEGGNDLQTSVSITREDDDVM